MFLPSSRAWVSTLTYSPTTPRTWSRILVPSSGWAISRPRNCSVTLTLCPSWMNWSTLRTLTSKSPRPILGRNLTSLTDTFVDLRRDSLAFWASSYRNLP